MNRVWIFPLLGALTLLGCQRDKISVYKAPKETPDASMPMAGMGMPSSDGGNMPMGGDGSMSQSGAAPGGDGQLPPGHPPVDDMSSASGQMPEGHPPIDGRSAGMMGGATASADRGVTWKAPKSWTEKPASQMRLASFSATGKNGQPVDISVVALAGEAGGELSNVNRWRGQIELPPVSEDALAGVTRRISPSGRKMLLADMVGDKPAIDNKYKKRLVAAIYSHGGQSWFFKMIGEDSAVAENVPSLMKFLESLKFADE